MRRTYRSKKETGGGLDPKDIIQTLDDRSSAFDAFYIQNIKQTKQELSCIGSSNQQIAGYTKVRKKKYVKRLINKKAEPALPESMYYSTCLTPDKSIRVNKGKDLFDQLLNSSSQDHTDNSLENKKLFNIKKKSEKKTYCNTKASKHSRMNYSTSDNDSNESNKENTILKDVSISKHQLRVEKDSNYVHKNCDDSINRIVNNLSLIKDLRRKQSKINLRKSIINHRLTNSVQSPILKGQSPLSSTPFTNRCKKQSIYKFSPIKFGNLDETSNFLTIKEVNYEQNTNKEVTSRINSDPLFSDSSSDINKLSIFGSQEVNIDKNHTAKNIEERNSLKISSKGESLERSTDKPFHGFTPDPTLEDENRRNKNKCEVLTQINDDSSIIEFSEINHTTPIEPLLGFTQAEENVSVSSESEEAENSINSVQCNFDKSSSSHNSSMDSKENLDASEDGESLYDTCNSEQSSQDTDTEPSKEPVVEIERLNTSLFQKYYEKMILSQICNESSNSLESVEKNYDDKSKDKTYDEFTDMETSFDNKDKDESCLEISLASDESLNISKSENDRSRSNSNLSLHNKSSEVGGSHDNSNSEDLLDSKDESLIDNSYNEEESRCISFVNTRRGNEISNTSLIFLDDSFVSQSSSECNKTVVSKSCNKDQAIEESYIVPEDSIQRDNNEENGRCSFITNRKSRKITQDNMDNTDSQAPLIVLQPGKKWERSLSIYRRISVMNETFNESILNEDLLQNKGRKYRQSVISTMEIQESFGSVHNESIVSRRSTILAKPSRSTIKIVRDHNSSAVSLCSSISEDFNGFLTEDCDDTIVELSKLSIADDHEVTAIGRVHDTSGCISTARDYVLRRCNQTRAILFDECYPDTVLKNCHKIGEGVYGEVFLWRASDGARVMKVVPVAGTTKVNGEHQKDFHEIISEIVIAMELSALRAPIREIESHIDAGKDVDLLDLHAIGNATDVFNEVLAVRCLHGHYPSRLLELWELFDECKGSENDHPASLPRDQQYVVLELANAGQDLESYQFHNAEQAHAVFWQIAFGLAVAEEAYQFEHRDLHWGNVLIAPTDQECATFVLRGSRHSVARGGAAATIIDYSLSRVRLALHAGACADLYNDLAQDHQLFQAAGDYQFDVYRLMRDKLGNDWKNFEPYTNILWLHYTVDKMITALRYKRTNTKIHKHYIAKLKDIKNRILGYESAVQFVLTDNEY